MNWPVGDLNTGDHVRHADRERKMGSSNEAGMGPGWNAAVDAARKNTGALFAGMMCDPGAFIGDLEEANLDIVRRALGGLLAHRDDDKGEGWLVWNGEIHHIGSVDFRDGSSDQGYTLLVLTDPPPPPVDPARQRMAATVRGALVASRIIGDPDDLDRITEVVVDQLLAEAGTALNGSGWLLHDGEAHELIEVHNRDTFENGRYWELSTQLKNDRDC